MRPYTVKNKYTGKYSDIPCGKCPACKTRRVNIWAFRLMQEEKTAISSQFITLTYDSANIPITSVGNCSLSKTDLQKFFKRLRRNAEHQTGGNTGEIKESSIKYFAVGEYGTKTNRPHYHIILFNAPIAQILPSWDNGEVHYGKVEAASVKYTLKYMLKKGKKQADDMEPQFALMSKGLGLGYLTPEMLKWHKADKNNRMYTNLLDGKKVPMSRYYKEKIYPDKQELKAIGVNARIQTEKERERKKYPDLRYYKPYHEAVKAEWKKMENSITQNEKL